MSNGRSCNLTRSRSRLPTSRSTHQQQPTLAEAEDEARRGGFLHRDANGDDRAAEQHRGDERCGVGGETLGITASRVHR